MTNAPSDVDRLLNESVGLAEQMLLERREFLPYGAVLRRDGEIMSVAIDGDDEQARSATVVAELRKGLRQGAAAGEYTATAIISNVQARVRESERVSAAIAVALDHVEGYSVMVVIPYEIGENGIEYGELYSQEGDGLIFSE